jgi:RimJ/RimL family protein N-acetyltransferase
MLLRSARPLDILGIAALERAPGASGFVGQWTPERHLATMTGGDARYYVSETGESELQAYVILRGLQEDSGSIELKRVVVATPGLGLGRRILDEIIQIAFSELHAHRLFLDVFEDNRRARHLYESLGFQYEGVMREAARRDDAWCNLHLMSMLAGEYAARGQ